MLQRISRSRSFFLALPYAVLPFSSVMVVAWLLSLVGAFRFSPSADFLTLAAAFEAMAASVVIPLSLDMASRISERYQSEVITRAFIQTYEVRLFPALAISSIIFTILLRFFTNSNHLSSIGKLLAWGALLGFLAVAGNLFLFIAKLRMFLTNVDFILDGLFDDAERFFE